MRKRSIRVYILLIVILTISSVITVFLPQSDILTIQQELPASKGVVALVNALIMILLYGSLGYIGLRLSIKLGFARLWDNKVNNKERFLYPAIYGILAGFLLIIFDKLFSLLFSLKPLVHPPFPTSFFASLSAGIGEEIIFRLFFIPFWLWLVSIIILKDKYKETIFWIVTTFSAILFAAAHLPSVMILQGAEHISDVSIYLIIEIFLLNSFISFPAAYYFRKYGILAAIGIHFWADIIWHVIYGIF